MVAPNSGGQKARITLARAVYSSAEIIILDDVSTSLLGFLAVPRLTLYVQGPCCFGRPHCSMDCREVLQR